MILIKYSDTSFSIDTIVNKIESIINQVYKLLPLREEEKNWKATAAGIIIDLRGLNNILTNQFILFNVLIKLEGIIDFDGDKHNDFLIFRKVIFDCLNLLTKLKKEVENERVQ